MCRLSSACFEERGWFGDFYGINVSLHVKPLAWCPGQVKIMKEFVWINIIVFLNLAFRQVGEKKFCKNWNERLDLC